MILFNTFKLQFCSTLFQLTEASGEKRDRDNNNTDEALDLWKNMETVKDENKNEKPKKKKKK